METLKNSPEGMELVWQRAQSLALEAKYISSIFRGLGL